MIFQFLMSSQKVLQPKAVPVSAMVIRVESKSSPKMFQRFWSRFGQQPLSQQPVGSGHTSSESFTHVLYPTFSVCRIEQLVLPDPQKHDSEAIMEVWTADQFV